MPLINSAIKKLRQDQKREKIHSALMGSVEVAVGKMRKEKIPTSLASAFSAIDKAVKKHLMHKNKAARMKSSLSKLLPAQQTSTPKEKASTKSTTKKRAVKSS